MTLWSGPNLVIAVMMHRNGEADQSENHTRRRVVSGAQPDGRQQNSEEPSLRHYLTTGDARLSADRDGSAHDHWQPPGAFSHSGQLRPKEWSHFTGSTA